MIVTFTLPSGPYRLAGLNEMDGVWTAYLQHFRGKGHHDGVLQGRTAGDPQTAIDRARTALDTYITTKVTSPPRFQLDLSTLRR